MPELVFSAIAFALSLVILIVSSKTVIDKSIKLSAHYGISQLAIGFILIAIMVSLPDLLVSVIASVSGKPELGIGDALGSTIANICLVLGIATLMKKINVERKHVLDSTELLLLIGAVPAIFLALGTLGRLEGLILLAIFFVYSIFMIKEKFVFYIKNSISDKEFKKTTLWFFISLFAVVVSAKIVVDSAQGIALAFGFSEAVLGLTLISFGTTLPELAIDFTAIRKGQTALAIGDILGSSVINLTLILGSVLAINPIRTNISVFTIAICFVIIANSFLFYSLVKHEGIGKQQGIVFILLYITFIIATFGSKIITGQ